LQSGGCSQPPKKYSEGSSELSNLAPCQKGVSHVKWGLLVTSEKVQGETFSLSILKKRLKDVKTMGNYGYPKVQLCETPKPSAIKV